MAARSRSKRPLASTIILAWLASFATGGVGNYCKSCICCAYVSYDLPLPVIPERALTAPCAAWRDCAFKVPLPDAAVAALDTDERCASEPTIAALKASTGYVMESELAPACASGLGYTTEFASCLCATPTVC